MKNIGKSTFREIKSSFGRFAAILAIIALGVGFFAGLKVTKAGMLATMKGYLDEHTFHDFRLISTLGLEEEDAEWFRGQEEVEAAEGAVSFDVLYVAEDGSQGAVKTISLTDSVDTVKLVAGRMPERGDECVADRKMLDESAIGSVLALSGDNEEEVLKHFVYGAYTVVGLVQSPLYIQYERGNTSIGTGQLAGYVYLRPDGYDADYYTEVDVRFRQEHELYGDAYTSYIDEKEELWKSLLEQAANRRYRSILADAEKELADAGKELADKRADGERELADVAQKLADAREELADGEQAIADAKKELADGGQAIVDGREELADAARELADKREKLESGRKELADAKQALADGRETLEGGKQELADAREMLEAGRKELADGRRALEEARKSLEQGRTELEEQSRTLEAGAAFMEPETLAAARAQLAAAGAALDAQEEQLAQKEQELAAAERVAEEKEREVAEGERELAGREAELAAAERELAGKEAEFSESERKLAEAETELADAGRELAEREAELADGERELADREAELADAKQELADGEQEYRDAQEEFDEKLADAEAELADAKAELAELEAPDTYVLGRNTNVGYVCFENDSNIVEGIALVFPVFFFLVAALVCITTMNRMVEEQRTQIGVLKALGYGNFAIMSKYMAYSGLAAVIGCVSGFALGTWGFPKVIWYVYGIMYQTEPMVYVFNLRLALVSLFVSLLCSVGTTWLSCRMELAAAAAQLMRPKAPKAGKRVFLERIPFLWKHLSFLRKVSVRNIFRYKKRLFMMVLGISGCTALLVTGFGIKDSIADVADRQYEDIQIYDLNVSFREDVDERMERELDELCGRGISDYLCVAESSVDLVTERGTKSVCLVAAEPERMADYVNLRTEKGESIDYPAEGAVITRKLAKQYGIRAGDEITLRDDKLRAMQLSVAAVMENYVNNYVYVSEDTWRRAFGEEKGRRSAYVNVEAGADAHELSAELMDIEGVANVTVNADIVTRVDNMMSSLNIIVVVVILCAAGLAFIVLYNLTNINITERIREIATIKVLGFYRRETESYVFRENLLLAVLGMLPGLVLGRLLHAYVMSRIQIDLIAFAVRVAPVSYLFSALLTLAFAWLVNLGMGPKLEGISMTESLKSVD